MVNWITFLILIFPNKGQYFQRGEVWHHDWWTWIPPGDQGLSNMLVHVTYTQGIHCISHWTCQSLVSKWRWLYFLKHRTSWNLIYKPKYVNTGNWVFTQDKFTDVCVTLLLSWTCYLWSGHFRRMDFSILDKKNSTIFT